MEKIRISSLAKELGVTSCILIEKCHEKGLAHITHHANTLLPEQAEMIKQIIAGGAKPTPQKRAEGKGTHHYDGRRAKEGSESATGNAAQPTV